jgi:thioredoxin-dependent peroxiredoxin
MMRFAYLTLALAALLSTAGAPSAAAQNEAGKIKVRLQGGPDVGQRAPDFSLPWANRDGIGPVESPYQLASDRGKTVVVAFYPRDFTKGCTAEMRTFAEQYDSLIGPNVVLVGISSDSVATHSRFAASLGLPFRLLSDPEQRVSKQYASKDPDGYNRRTIYVVGPDGRVKFRNLNFNATDPSQYAELRAAVKSSTRGS